ncbi:hypothetical protein M5E88_12360 [Akkermansia muciniphila]|nr:hypothetical protein M5E88_12360 [Akkermansia muciniphila]
MSGYGLLLHDIFSGQGWRDALNVAEAAGGKTDVFSSGDRLFLEYFYLTAVSAVTPTFGFSIRSMN